jgi:transcriptional repressor NrdR
VVNSRQQRRTNKVWRRRHCPTCGNIFTTLESPQLATSLLFKSSLGHLEPFSRDKLFLSIYNSLGHRKDATAEAAALTDTVISKLTHKVSNAQLDCRAVITITTETLRRFDKAAATVYAAYHPL